MSFAKNKSTARVSSEFFCNAMNVMKGAEGISKYTGLTEKEAFRIEYWDLKKQIKKNATRKRISWKSCINHWGCWRHWFCHSKQIFK